MNYLIKISDEIAEASLEKEEIEEVFFDPITMAIVSTIIQIAIREFVIPYIKRRCAERQDKIGEVSQHPRFFQRWLLRRSLRKAEKITQTSFASAGTSIDKVEKAIFSMGATMSPEEIQIILQEN